MTDWLASNIGTICIAFILVAVVALIVVKLVKEKRNGRSSCGCNCAHCAMAGRCHKDSEGR